MLQVISRKETKLFFENMDEEYKAERHEILVFVFRAMVVLADVTEVQVYISDAYEKLE